MNSREIEYKDYYRESRMSPDRYQERTRRHAQYPNAKTEPWHGALVEEAVNYTLMGLGGEVGELQNKFKKTLRGDPNKDLAAIRKDLLDEAGDVLWYLTRFIDELGGSLQDVLEDNATKLDQRLLTGTIKGDGDHR